MAESITRRSLLAAAVPAFRLPKKIRVGVVFMEGHTGEVFRPIEGAPDIELAAVSDPNPGKMAKLAAGVRRYGDYRQMLEKEQLDVVGIGGPNHLRSAVILACAARKVHIAAEKPLAIERADLERVREAVRQSQVHLTMFLPMRFSSPYLAMKQVVDSGEIGEIAQIDAQKSYKLGERASWMLKHETYGGTIPYIGVHMVDLMRWISGRDFVEAVSLQNRVGYPEYGQMENTTGTLFRLDNGGVGVLHMDYLRPLTAVTHGDDRLRIAGTKGVVEYQQSTGVTVISGKQKARTITDLPPTRSLFLDFLDSVYNQKPAGLPLADIYRVNEIVLGAREAAEKGAFVKL
ncbi:MAG TPA: Gfo/Idh/MocA family oxidoreductase [Bryobacteraceae bacterium]|nr:Gfo/Idh/MocA family oxidoreductase [Bryobacteraceae bacterium]